MQAPSWPEGPWIGREHLATQQARAALALGRHSAALEALRRVPRRRAPDPAARALAEADALVSLHRCREACALASRALRRGGFGPDHEARLRLLRAQALWRAGRIAAACAEAVRAAALPVDESTRARLTEALALIDWHDGRVEDALQRLQEARAAYARLADLGGLARVTGTEAALRRTTGRAGAALALCTRRLEIARAGTRLDLLALAHHQRAQLAVHLGQWQQARADAERAAELFRGLGDPRELTLAGVALARLELAEGRVEAARATLERAREALAAAGDEPASRAEISLGLSDVALAEGSADVSVEEAGLALRAFTRAGRRGGQCRARVRLAHALVAAGRAREALSVARRASAQAERGPRQLRALALLTLGRALLRVAPERAGRVFARAQSSAGPRHALAQLARLGASLARSLAHEPGPAPDVDAALGELRAWGDERLVLLCRQDLAELGFVRPVVSEAPTVAARVTREDEEDAFPGILGRCAPMRALFRELRRVASADVAVFVLGETGTGKERVARALHDCSRRRARAFVAVNASSLSDELFEAELCGHARGAFTGAVMAREGLLAQADGGTLFLDEVADLSPRAQAKLLRFLQEGEYRRLGENELRRADVRVVSAANRDLEACVAAGTFREDLLYRLNTVVLRLPPLRERDDDLLLLARHFARQAAQRAGRPAPVVAGELARRLAAHAWPGNVRELENEMRRLVALCAGAQLSADDLSPRVARGATPATTPAALGEDLSLRAAQLEFERTFVARALTRHGGQRARTAEALGITRQALLAKLQRLGLE